MTKTTVSQTDCLGTGNSQNTRDVTVSSHPNLHLPTNNSPQSCRFPTRNLLPGHAAPVSPLSDKPHVSCVSPPKQSTSTPPLKRLHPALFKIVVALRVTSSFYQNIYRSAVVAGILPGTTALQRATGRRPQPSRRRRSSMVSGRRTQPDSPSRTQRTPGRVKRL